MAESNEARPMTADIEDDRRVVVISSDCHAGGSILDYKPYLESKWHAAFDEWAKAFYDPWAEVEKDLGTQNVGVASLNDPVNWDNPARQKGLESDGVVAEVVFPNTVPPFFPTGVISVGPPQTREEYEHRWAGLRAHNRWLKDFCDVLPGRRAGVAQLLLNNVEDAVKEVEWIKEAGLKGGVLLPGDHTTGQTVALYYPKYDPIWEVCAELDVPVHRHSSFSGDMSSEDNSAAAAAVTVMESPFYWHRGLAHLIFSGVFERFPKLKYILTEQGAGWVPAHLAQLDAFYKGAKEPGTIRNKFAGDAVAALPKLPSEYFAEHCYLGASAMMPAECERRYDIGVDRIMWGTDFPHAEGTYPYSRAALSFTFDGVPFDEMISMLGGQAAKIYGFDYEFLQGVANSIGPTRREMKAAALKPPNYPNETVCGVFA
jgi:predicted TIM-barrel fold metal-dependent hydrolase